MSDKHDLLNDNDMCSFSGHEVEDMCFNSGDDACGDSSVDVKVEINMDTKSPVYGLFRSRYVVFTE